VPGLLGYRATVRTGVPGYGASVLMEPMADGAGVGTGVGGLVVIDETLLSFLAANVLRIDPRSVNAR
jgi:hypothetical protein